MKLITKIAAPSSLQKYIRQSNATYDDLDTDVKNDLRNSLIAEQYGACAYCQQRLSEGKIKIEHHCERSICNGENGTTDRRLDYTNLFAVCLGKGGLPEALHCDTQKATLNKNNGLPMTLIPTNAAHIATIRYSSTGNISSSNSLYEQELNHILALNTPHLKAMRKSKWMGIFSNSIDKNRGINKVKMAKLIHATLVKKDGQFTRNFPGLAEFMQKKFCS